MTITLTGTLASARACVSGRMGRDAVLIFDIAGDAGWPLEARRRSSSVRSRTSNPI